MLVTTRRNLGERPAFLTSIGSTHDDTDPSSLKYKLGEVLLERWTTLTEGLPRCILYEGRSETYGPTKDSSIRNYFGETGYLKWHANDRSIDAITMEPSYVEEFQAVHRSYPAGDGVVENSEDIVRAIVGVRMLPFIHVKASDIGDSPVATPECVFEEYLQNDGRMVSPGITLGNFSEIFEKYFDKILRLDEFIDPNNPLIAQCRAITEPVRFKNILDSHPKLAGLAEVALLTQKTRTRILGRKLLSSYMDGISVFKWSGLPHEIRLQSKLARIDTLYDPEEYDPSIRLIPGYEPKLIKHNSILGRTLGGIGLKAYVNL